MLDKAEILGVLDKHYLSFRKAKHFKNIFKIDAGFPISNMLVLDEIINTKYYQECEAAVCLVEGFHNQTKLARVGGKLVRMQDYDEKQLKTLASKINRCAEKGGDWD